MIRNADILKTLDKMDEYMIKHINATGKVPNSEDINPRMILNDLNKIIKILDEQNEQGAIRTRVNQLRGALNYAISSAANLPNDNRYFDWLKEKRIPPKTSEPNSNLLYYEVLTGHQSAFQVSYLREAFSKQNTMDALFQGIEDVQKQYDKFIERDNIEPEKSLTVVPKRKSIFARIAEFFRGKPNNTKQQSNMRNEYMHVDNSSNNAERSSAYRQSMYVPESNRQPVAVEQKPEGKDQHIVISDLHGNMYRWKLVKEAMKQNPNMKVTILGDAMDRGEFGVEILLQIKELSDQGKVEYLPGNHDIFAYNYMRMGQIKLTGNDKNLIHIEGTALGNLMKNGGEKTIENLDNFEQIVSQEIKNGNIRNAISKNELINWLGQQPIQRKVNEKGINYALAHAFFDDELYKYDPTFNLEKALNIEIAGNTHDPILNKFNTVMWYREGNKNTQYAPVKFPTGSTMVVGHTRQEQVNAENYQGNPNQQILYVDTGKAKEFEGLDLTNAKNIKLENQNQR